LNTEAAAVLRLAQQRHPADFWVNYLLGHTLIICPRAEMHPADAVAYCRAAVAIRPGSAEALSLLGVALSNKGDK
jgi:hypothetical protein